MIGLWLWAVLSMAGDVTDTGMSGDDSVVDEVEAGSGGADSEDTGSEEPMRSYRDASGERVHEVVVYGDILVEQAKQEVLQGLSEVGFDQVKDMGDYLRVRSGRVWHGEVRIYDDGWVRMKRQPLRVMSPTNTPAGWALCVIAPFACVRPAGWTASKRIFQAQKLRTLETVDPQARVYAESVADVRTEAVIQELPDRLDALWTAGTPLEEGGVVLETPEARRAALIAYWRTRTDTVWGDRVREAVEGFMRAVVQTSDHPFTEAEIAEANARRTGQRELVL